MGAVPPALLAALALAASLDVPEPAAPPDHPPAVLLVRGGPFTGSGMVWDSATRRVLTALHVVEEMPEGAIEIILPGRDPLPARIVDREPLLDLAVLEVAGALDAAPPLGAAATLVPGDRISLVACPQARCGRGEGHVLAAARPFAGSRYLALAAEVAPGASGSPVLDARGAVVGIVDLALLREPGVALAVPIERATARFPRG